MMFTKGGQIFLLFIIFAAIVGCGVLGIVEWCAYCDHCPDGYIPTIKWPFPPIAFAVSAVSAVGMFAVLVPKFAVYLFI